MLKTHGHGIFLSLILSLSLFLIFFLCSINTNYTKYSRLSSEALIDIKRQKKRDYYSKKLEHTGFSFESRIAMFSTRTFEDVPQTLYEHLAFQFPYKIKEKFPDYIWQFWKYEPSESKFDSRLRLLEASWAKHHNNSIHTIVKEEYGYHLIRHLYLSIPDIVKAYDALSTSSLKARFFRYLILFARGGIYSDINTEILLPASKWISKSIQLSSIGLVIGIEVNTINHPNSTQNYSNFLQFSTGTIMAKPGHPILREIIVNITQEILKKKQKNLNKNNLKFTKFRNCKLWTNIIFDYLSYPNLINNSTVRNTNISYSYLSKINKEKAIKDIVILPITSFSLNKKYLSNKTLKNPQAILRHKFEDIMELNS
ncbi:uncharacterized protein T551_02556 [Pneumocystis jirovecii RU7]|uniref:Uncharacterized protein n=1 Tax=Pneumocystis jirovecii (strain RU7) TaxID=1408657 RepID=A0A0W4ZK02_PNEJ7|nr:uncharacterized protein T551_02556 [Pneumocystis jirovecii RU7]KTW28706.1 hypothetical protein T551_02556 [Pneumocystis jirovecii RU7]